MRPWGAAIVRLMLLSSCCLQHCAGVESLALSDDGATLFTASRDATVRSWQASGEASGQHLGSFEGHSNWVNDAVVVSGALVTCSSDCTISVWDAQATGDFPFSKQKRWAS